MIVKALISVVVPFLGLVLLGARSVPAVLRRRRATADEGGRPWVPSAAATALALLVCAYWLAGGVRGLVRDASRPRDSAIGATAVGPLKRVDFDVAIEGRHFIAINYPQYADADATRNAGIGAIFAQELALAPNQTPENLVSRVGNTPDGRDKVLLDLGGRRFLLVWANRLLFGSAHVVRLPHGSRVTVGDRAGTLVASFDSAAQEPLDFWDEVFEPDADGQPSRFLAGLGISPQSARLIPDPPRRDVIVHK